MNTTGNSANKDGVLTDLRTNITSLLRDVESSLNAELGSVRGQVAQIQNLLTDAIASLHDNFENLNKHTSEQMKLMESLHSDVCDEGKDEPDAENISQRTQNISEALKNMVAREIESSEQTLTAFRGMEKLKLQIQKTDHTIKKFAETLQAMDESDEKGNGELASLIGKGKQHQATLESAWENMRKEFVMANKHLDISANRDIQDIYIARENVETLLQHIYGVNETIADFGARMSMINNSIRKDLGALVRCLQFEDIVGQCLGHTQLHLDRMDGFTLLITQALEGIDDAGDADITSCMDILKQLQADVMEYRQGLSLEESSPVCQQNMEEGDVDLF